MPWQRWRVYLLCLACVALGGIIVWFIPRDVSVQTFFDQPSSPHLSSEQTASFRGAVVRQSSVNYRFIAPLLTCDVGSEEAFPEFAPLKAILTNLVTQKVAAGDAHDVSIYLRSMLSARWFEINRDTTYTPASLAKIFLMMAYYKEANETDNPGLLDKQIPFVSSSRYVGDVISGNIANLVEGKLYTVDHTISQMLTNSDNDAFTTLYNSLDVDTLSKLETVFHDLNISLPASMNDRAMSPIAVNEYATIYRVLFGSTYISGNYSEKALRLLAESKYRGGIAAGIPQSFIVAHKYGVLVPPPNSAASTTSTELHDCGIVYYPQHPYLLCVMTKGSNVAALQSTIKDISASAYQWLDEFYKKLPPASDMVAPNPTAVRP